MKQNSNAPKRRPLTALSTQKPIQQLHISSYRTSRELMKMKHKQQIMFDSSANQDNPIQKIIRRGPSLLGNIAKTNNRPSSSYINIKLKPSSKIDENKISKVIRRLSVIKLQNQWIHSLLLSDQSDEIIKEMRQKSRSLSRQKYYIPSRPQSAKKYRKTSQQAYKSLMLESSMDGANRSQLLVKSFFIS